MTHTIRALLLALALLLAACGALTEAPPRAVPTAITPVTRSTQEARAASPTVAPSGDEKGVRKEPDSLRTPATREKPDVDLVRCDSRS